MWWRIFELLNFPSDNLKQDHSDNLPVVLDDSPFFSTVAETDEVSGVALDVEASVLTVVSGVLVVSAGLLVADLTSGELGIFEFSSAKFLNLPDFFC